MQIWLRDVQYKRSGAENLIINKDELDSISKFALKYNADYYGIISMLENSINDVDYNVNLELMLFNLFIKIREMILAGEANT